jgi:hypothetical protein
MSDAPIQPERRPLPFPGEPPERSYPDPYQLPRPPVDAKAAKGRLFIPGIFVILIGLMNLLPGTCCISFGLFAQTIPDSQIEAESKRMQGEAEYERAKKQQGDPVKMAKGIYLYGGIGALVISVLLLLVAAVGGGCMIAGRSMFLCSMGALAAILSPGGFGLFGLGVGIWAFVVLFSEDVREAFRAS